MKKFIMALVVASSATFVHAQGLVVLNNGNANYLVSTNDGAAGSLSSSGNVGVTLKTPAGSFDYAVLTANYGGAAPSSDPLAAVWSAPVVTGANFGVTAGGILGQGGTGGAAAAGWAPSQDLTSTDGTEKYFMIVGWSSNLGTSWSTVSGELASGWNGFSVGQGVFGESGIGYGFSGGGPNNLPASSLWGVTGAMPGGLTSGFELNGIVPTPEPTTIALGVMGAASLLALRRKKA